MEVLVSAPAKINLTLEITGKRPDGYHDLSMIMQAVTLSDYVIVSSGIGSGISVSCDNYGVPQDEKNICFSAAAAFFEATGIINDGVQVDIRKTIPPEAGLAGGSTDAAAVLVALNEIYGAGLSDKELARIGEGIGADVPFCIYGGTMYAQGIGSELTALSPMKSCTFVIVKPLVNVSTKEAYRQADDHPFSDGIKTKAALKALKERSLKALGKSLYNDFEQILKIQQVENIKHTLLDYGALGAEMTGSGSAVFGIFRDMQKAKKCSDELTAVYSHVYSCQPCEYGCQIIK